MLFELLHAGFWCLAETKNQHLQFATQSHKLIQTICSICPQRMWFRSSPAFQWQSHLLHSCSHCSANSGRVIKLTYGLIMPQRMYTHTHTLYSTTGADRLLCSGDGSNRSAGYLPPRSDPYVQAPCYPSTSRILRSLSGLLSPQKDITNVGSCLEAKEHLCLYAKDEATCCSSVLS